MPSARRWSHKPYPEPVRGPAADSLAQALAVADRLGPQGQQLAEAGKTAFVDAVDSSYLVMAAIVGVAAVSRLGATAGNCAPCGGSGTVAGAEPQHRDGPADLRGLLAVVREEAEIAPGELARTAGRTRRGR